MSETKAIESLRQANCCACNESMQFSKYVNMVSLQRKPTWKDPVCMNMASGYGPTAMAIVCDDCIRSGTPISHAIELNEGLWKYHDVESLEELPPEPTYVVQQHPTGVESITCLVCSMTSYHPEDVRNKYCGNCKQFHSVMMEARG